MDMPAILLYSFCLSNIADPSRPPPPPTNPLTPTTPYRQITWYGMPCILVDLEFAPRETVWTRIDFVMYIDNMNRVGY